MIWQDGAGISYRGGQLPNHNPHEGPGTTRRVASNGVNRVDAAAITSGDGDQALARFARDVACRWLGV